MTTIKNMSKNQPKQNAEMQIMGVKTFINDSMGPDEDIDKRINSFLSETGYKLVDIKIVNVPYLNEDDRGYAKIHSETRYTVIYDSRGY